MDYGTKQKLSPNPREKANILSKIFFVWMVPLFYQGAKKNIEIEDVYRTLPKDKSDALGDILERHYSKETAKAKIKNKGVDNDSKSKSKPSLLKSLFKTLWVDVLYLGILVFLNEIVLRLAMPIFLGKLLNYFRLDSQVSYESALWYAGAVVFFQFANAFAMNHYMLGGFLLGMKARIAVCSLIYRKSLRLSHSALGESAPGKVVNLLSNDVNRFDLSGMFLHYLWAGPLSAILAVYFILAEIGVSGIFGIMIVFTVMPIQAYTGRLSAKFRLQTALKTDERVRFMGEIISGVQVIKMYVWEKSFKKLVTWARKLELKEVRKISYVRAIYMTFLQSTTRIGMYFVMFSMVLFGLNLTAERVFVVAAYFQILAITLSSMFVRAIAEVSEAIVALKRLENFLNHNEFSNDPPKIENGVGKDGIRDSKIKISLKDVRAKWDLEETNPTIEIDNFSIYSGKLTGVIGPVGSGKSSLLQILLKEMPISRGDLNVNGTVSYASQDPWVFGAPIRQNILFGQAYDKKRYNEVVKVCALLNDFEQFPHGDQTIVGERGASLSGGQKARINLARAVYRKADIYLLDDPLSAVDAHVGKHLFDKCILGFLKHKTRVLVTHQLHHLKKADYIALLQDGKIKIQDTYEGFCNSSNTYAQLLTSEEPSEHTEDITSPELSLGHQKDYTRKRERINSCVSQRKRSESISSSIIDVEEIINQNFDDDDVKKGDKEKSPQKEAEASSKSTVKGSKLLMYFKAGTSIPLLLFVAFTFLITQVMVSAADFWMSFWTAQEELRRFYTVKLNSTNETDEDFADLVVKNDSILSTSWCMGIHGFIVAFLLIISMWRAIEFYNVCMRSSQALHDDMFQGIIRAPMRFFNTNPSGRVLNRFAKDMGNMDEWLPKALLDATQAILNIVGAFCLTCYANPVFVLPFIFMSFIFLLMRNYYLKTSKNLKRLEGIHRSPVFTHLTATLQGLPTIRAFGTQEILKAEFDEFQDIHTATWSLFCISSSSFGFFLDMLCSVLVLIVTFSFLLIKTDVLGETVGLAITQIMSLSLMLQWGVRQSAEVSNQMMAVERILEYKFLPPEDGIESEDTKKKAHHPLKEINVKPPRDWPEHAKIEFKDLYLKYSDDPKDQYVLKGLNCVIQSKQKVGIVGRTGAGKSSLISALFRLAYNEGKIIIDGVEADKISVQSLRKKISIIPQDPVLFSGTLRRNLDPFEEYSDKAVWDALEKVELKEALSSPSGLEMKVMDEGSNFSVGQRQLVCLARAILRNNRILVLDEATANVDPYTDNLIQRTIREKFEDCTVLTIAHRLNTIMDSDRVLVMDHGEIVEFDSPYLLMQNHNGILYKMVQETGEQNAKMLFYTAKEHYEATSNNYDNFKMIDE